MSTPGDFLNADGQWTCTSCGACCKSVWALIDKGFPLEWIRKNGACINQQKSGKCRIYKTRPPICRVENTLKPNFNDQEIAEMCAQMKNHMDGGN